MIRALLDVGAVSASVAVSRALVFVASLVLARGLDLHQFGAFTVAYTFVVLLGQVSGSLDISFVRFSAPADEGTPHRAWVRAFLTPKLAVALAIGLLAPMAGPLLAQHAFEKRDLALPLAVGIAGGGFFNLCTAAQAYFQSRRRLGGYAVITIAQGLLVLAAVSAWWLSGSRSLSVAIGVYTAVYAALGALSWALLLAASRPAPDEAGHDRTRELLTLALWLLPAHLAWLVAQRLDVLLLARLVPLAEAGIYGGAVRLLGALAILTGSLPVVFLPRAALAVERSGGLRAYLHSAAVTVVILVAIMLGAIALAPQLVEALLGEVFLPAATPLRWLIVSQALLTVAQPAVDLLIAAGHSRAVLVQRLVQLAVAVSAGPPLILAMGLTGGALGAVATALTGCAFAWTAVWRRVVKVRASR